MGVKTFSLDSPAEMQKWDEFVASHPNGTPYHSSRWLRALRDTYSFRPILYGLKREHGELAGVLPLFSIRGILSGEHVVSLPFSDYGGPLFSDEREEVACVQEILSQHSLGARRIEIRGRVPEGCGLLCLDYYKRHVLQLSADVDRVLKNVDRRTIQYSIRKAEKSGIRILEDNSETGMAEFVRLNLLTRKKHGVPTQPGRFFEILQKEILAEGLGFLLLAVHESKVVAGSLFLKTGRAIHYKYNASDPSVLGKLTPNHLLTWHAVIKGCNEGCTLVDFGRTSPDNLGLMRYKAMWGAVCLDAPYYFYPKVRGASSAKEKGLSYRVVTGVWKKLPDYVAAKVGPLVYRHIV